MISKYSLHDVGRPSVHGWAGAGIFDGKRWSNTADTVFGMANCASGSGCCTMQSRLPLRMHEPLMLAEVLLMQLISGRSPNIPACRHGMRAHASCSVTWTKVSMSIWPMQVSAGQVLCVCWAGCTVQCCRTYSVSLTRASKGVLSCEGMLSACRSKASARYGNCREAARPVPSMPGRYTMRGRSSWVALGARPGMYGLMKRGGPPARHTAGSSATDSDV